MILTGEYNDNSERFFLMNALTKSSVFVFFYFISGRSFFVNKGWVVSNCTVFSKYFWFIEDFFYFYSRMSSTDTPACCVSHGDGVCHL